MSRLLGAIGIAFICATLLSVVPPMILGSEGDCKCKATVSTPVDPEDPVTCDENATCTSPSTCEAPGVEDPFDPTVTVFQCKCGGATEVQACCQVIVTVQQGSGIPGIIIRELCKLNATCPANKACQLGIDHDSGDYLCKCATPP